MGIRSKLFGPGKGKRAERSTGRGQALPHKDQRVNPLEIAQATDIGRTREINEDAFLTLGAVIGTDAQPIPIALLIIADGMGGHAGGREASTTAVRVAGRTLLTELLLPVLIDDTKNMARRPIQEVLTEATMFANQSVSGIGSDAGTTLTSVLLVEHSAYVAHVGDTRVYHIANNKVTQITHDHSLVSRLVELGEISPEEAQSHPQRNFLYRALGQGPDLEVDAHLQRLAKGSYLLLCSDGLWSNVSDQEILEVIQEAPSPQEACNRLLDLSNERGGEDNITVVLARINY